MQKTLILALAALLYGAPAYAAVCDIDADGDIDKIDLSLISKARGKTAPPMPAEYDADADGKITPADVMACIPMCTRPNCATQ